MRGYLHTGTSGENCLRNTGKLSYPQHLAAGVGIKTGGDRRNREFAGPHVESDAEAAAETLAYDPQTAGGLLVSLPAERAAVALAALAADGVTTARVGRVVEGSGVRLA